MSKRMYFLAYIIVAIFSFNIAHAGDPFIIHNKPNLSEIQRYLDDIKNPVTRILSDQVSATGSSSGFSSEQDTWAQIDRLMQQLVTTALKLGTDYILSTTQLLAADSNVFTQILSYTGSSSPTAPSSLTAVSGRWTVTATRTASYPVLYDSNGVPIRWNHSYTVRSVTDSSTGKTYGDVGSAVLDIGMVYFNEVMQLANDYLSAVSVLIAQAGLPKDLEAIFGGKLETLQPLSTELKLESRFGFNTPGRFNRWIDDLVPGEFKKLGPPFPPGQAIALKGMKQGIDRVEQLAREKEQQNEQRERIEQDLFLTEEQKKHAREYYDSNYVNLTDKEDAEYVGLYKSAGDFARIEKEGDGLLSKVDTNRLDHEQPPQVDGTSMEGHQDREPSAVNDLVAQGKELGSSLSGVVKYGVQITAEGVAQLNKLPIAPAFLALNIYQSAQSGKTIGDKLGEIYFGEEGMLNKGVKIALSGFNETEIDYYWKHDIPEAAKRSMAAVVESVAPGVAGPVLGKIIRSR